MKKYFTLAALLLLLSAPVFAAGFDKPLTLLNPADRPTLVASSLDSSADYIYVYDNSLGNIVKVLVPDFLISSAAGAELDYVDITTLGTVQASKAVTTDSSNDTIYPATYAATFQSSATETFASGSTLTVAGTLTSTGTATFTAVTPTALVGPPPTAGGASITVTAAKAGQVIKLDTAAGTTVTLPAATGTGNHYFMAVTVAATSNAHKILAASSSDNITGIMVGQNANTNKSFQCLTSSGIHSIQMPFAGTQPSGGLQGDSFEFIDVGTNLWFVRGTYSAGTTPTTPCSTATT